MQTCLIVGGLKNPHLEDAAIARIHCPGVVIFAVKIAAGKMKTGPGKPFTEGFAIQRRYRRGRFGGRRFFKPALCGVIAGNLYGRFLRLKLLEFHTARRGRRAVPLTVLVQTLPQGADAAVEIGTAQDMPIQGVAIVLIRDGVFRSSFAFAVFECM